MTIKSETSAPEQVAQVAEVAEVACPCAVTPNRIDLEECNSCETADDGKCYASCAEGCHGTGRLYWWLWTECPKNSAQVKAGNLGCKVDPTNIHCKYRCDGTGWVLAVDLEGLWRVFQSFDLKGQYRIARNLEEQDPLSASEGFRKARRFIVWWGSLTDTERREALAAAILRARETPDAQ